MRLPTRYSCRTHSQRVLCVCAAVLVVVVGTSSIRGESLLLETFTGANGTLPSLWEADNNTGVAISRIDNNEFEQERVSASSSVKTLAAYINDDDTDRGVWRDVNVATTIRYNFVDSSNTVLGGLVIRGQEGSATGIDEGDFYHVRMNGTTMQLYRVNGGVFELLASHSGSDFTTTTNRELRVQIANIASPSTDQVRIQAQLMSTDNVTALRSIDFTDTSSSAITRAGTVGFRALPTSGASVGSRFVYDNLAVESSNPRLLWYEDYYNNTAPREAIFADNVAIAVANGKRTFSAIGNGDDGISLIDFDSFTSQEAWTNVTASTLMRWSTQVNGGRLEGGLFVRGNDVTNAENTGSYYLLNLIRNEDANQSAVRIQRFIDGVGTQLDGELVSLNSLPESTDLFLQLTAIDVFGGVELTGIVSLSPDFSNPIAELSVIDSDVLRLLGPGTAGFRVNGAGSLNNTAVINFDNFTVVSIPEPLTVALLGMGGLLGLVCCARRAKHFQECNTKCGSVRSI